MEQLRLPEGVPWIGVKRRDGFPIETAYFKTVFDLVKPPMAPTAGFGQYPFFCT